MTRVNFRKKDVVELAGVLGLPDYIVTDRRERFSKVEATMVFLTRLRKGDTWEDEAKFLGGRDRASYGRCFHWVLNFVYENHASKMGGIDVWTDLAPELARLAAAAGSPAPDVIGFIDGTFRPIARPVRHQRQFYSGYKKRHGLKFQTVQGTNGLILDYWGPALGRRGDGFMFGRSGILGRLKRLAYWAGKLFYVYGDPAYALSKYVLRGWKGAMSPAQQYFSTKMSRFRITVEWGYGGVVRLFPYLDCKSKMKHGEQPLAKIYAVGVFMYNIHCCYYGNQISLYFHAKHPVLPTPAEYIGILAHCRSTQPGG